MREAIKKLLMTEQPTDGNVRVHRPVDPLASAHLTRKHPQFNEVLVGRAVRHELCSPDCSFDAWKW